MKNYEKIIGNAIRIEYEHGTGKLYVVFEIIDPESKKKMKEDWSKDIEYRIIDKSLIESNE